MEFECGRLSKTRTSKAVLSLIAIASVASGCVPLPIFGSPSKGIKTGATGSAFEARRGTLDILVSVDWEGESISRSNINAMVDFGKKHPNVPIVHFLNAAYYTKPAANAASVSENLARTLRPHDELGLHLHGWKSLFEAAGVRYRQGPSFVSASLTTSCAHDCGHDVSIAAYTASELSKVIGFSVNTLENYGFGRARSFRAGGWLAGPTVLEALAEQKFSFDHSAAPAATLALRMRPLRWPLVDMLSEMWPRTTSTSQPFVIESSPGELTEIPDNGVLADWVDVDQMTRVVDHAAEVLNRSPSTDQVVSIGFHQETASQYLPRLNAVLDHVEGLARDGVPVHFVNSKGAANRLGQ